MKKIIFCLYGLWAILAIVSYFFIGNIWVATSFLWIPVGGTLSLSAILLIIGDYGTRLKEREEHTCENCLWGSSVELINKFNDKNEKCLGETLYGATRGKVCEGWKRK